MLSPGLVERILQQVDLPTLARAEVSCSAIREIARSITIDGAIMGPAGCPVCPEAFTAKYVAFIRWLRRHAGQFRSMSITTDDHDLANGVGTALAKASKLHTLSVHTSSFSFTGNWSMVAAMTCAASAVPPLRILRLCRGTASTDFVQVFRDTLRKLEITVSSPEQVREVLAMDMPHLEDLTIAIGFPATVTLDSTFVMPGFPKLRHLAMKNMSFANSTTPMTLPAAGLETLQLYRCCFLERVGFQGLRVLISLTVSSMEFPECLDVSDLSELTLSMGTGRCVPPHIVLPNLTRFNAEHTDISMRPSQVPKMWSVALGSGCHGDTGWLVEVSRLFHLSI